MYGEVLTLDEVKNIVTNLEPLKIRQNADSSENFNNWVKTVAKLNDKFSADAATRQIKTSSAAVHQYILFLWMSPEQRSSVY